MQPRRPGGKTGPEERHTTVDEENDCEMMHEVDGPKRKASTLTNSLDDENAVCVSSDSDVGANMTVVQPKRPTVEPADDGFRSLLTRDEFARRQREMVMQSRATQKMDRDRRRLVWLHEVGCLPHRAPRVDGVERGRQGLGDAQLTEAHPSHRLKVIGQDDTALFFCTSCSGWSTDGPLQKLGRQCDPTSFRQDVDRLLRWGVEPCKGAVLPREAKEDGRQIRRKLQR